MTGIPITPETPEITPPTYNASGTTVVSGIPVSGTSFEGPWYVQEQSLYATYARKPYGGFMGASTTLSGASYTNPIIHGTSLSVEVDAYYRTYKDWNSYQTSAWSQPQKFEYITFSADTQGNTYGDLTASTLGPMGAIVTKQKFYARRPWNDASGDAEVEQLGNGASYFAYTHDGSGGAITAVDQTRYGDDFDRWFLEPCAKGTLIEKTLMLGEWGNGIYFIRGQYSTSQENLWKVIQTVETIGRHLSYGWLYSIPTKMETVSWASGLRPVQDVGVSEYRTSRHDYS